eukprot:CAMPEP_0182562556 /NCGR_PEP_ID=MMETSP1324-20130603/4881_1 /TAXON_ID=236786 /ORGANISM="Florenciella sp., Strain RCC1587" /LENGTH=71 /DNA_ID=CAMNT_0024775539 /DNA_START=133 /DNA_END=344 /DNA_ORIENTATION=+
MPPLRAGDGSDVSAVWEWGLGPPIGRNDSTKRLRFVGLGGHVPGGAGGAAAPPGGGGAVRTDREAGEGDAD